ncbi:MAG: NIL domain-containing protein [Thermoflexales bacterium]|nr:NIL domain-containing protein [Thermoflexales bacterium]
MQEKRCIKLTYPASLQDQPVLYKLIKDFDLATNIRRASVSTSEAWLIVDLEGQTDAIQHAVEWAAAQGLIVEDYTEA